jgi:thiol-disulfide isomerase/thioredoxin
VTRRLTARAWLTGGLLAAGLLGGLAGCAGGGTSDDVVDPGYQSGDGSTTLWAPDERTGPVDLAGSDAAGAAVDVADWRGDVVLVNTWYAACPPCRSEAPTLAALATDEADAALHVVGVNSTDTAATVQAFERQFAIGYPTIVDTDGAATAALQGVVPLNAVPTTVLLDREGRVAARILGLADDSTLRAIVHDLLAESGTP